MADIDNEQQSVAGVGHSPLDAILGDAAAVSRPTEAHPQGTDTDQPDVTNAGSDDEPQVSLLALHRERERRQKMDARVRELEEEIARYNEQKWGVEQPSAESAESADNAQFERLATTYNQSFARFVAAHGRDKVNAIDAAVSSLPPHQKAHVMSLVNQGDDPVEAIHQYVTQLGVLEKPWAPTPLNDALTGGKSEQPQPQSKAPDIDQRERAIVAAERSTAFNASRADFVSEFGRDGFASLDAATKSFLESGHAAAGEFAQRIARDADPVRAAATMLAHLGLWTPRAQSAAPALNMPTDLSSVRNVGSRGGPAFAGPTPLDDIFAR